MKNLARIITTVLLCLSGFSIRAQGIPAEIETALKADDSEALNKLVTKDMVNTCYYDYSLLSQTVRLNAPKCFALLLEKGANVNLNCNGYVPPLMHAAKYGRLEMVKALLAKGANVNFKYEGDNESISGMTPLTYAEKYKQTVVVEYLKEMTKK